MPTKTKASPSNSTGTAGTIPETFQHTNQILDDIHLILLYHINTRNLPRDPQYIDMSGHFIHQTTYRSHNLEKRNPWVRHLPS